MSINSKVVFFIFFSIVMALIIFKPMLFPRCACCGKTKIRTYFSYIAHVGMHLTYKGQLCVCKKCCAKYNIHSIYDYKKKSEIRKRIENKNKYI